MVRVSKYIDYELIKFVLKTNIQKRLKKDLKKNKDRMYNSKTKETVSHNREANTVLSKLLGHFKTDILLQVTDHRHDAVSPRILIDRSSNVFSYFCFVH